MWKSRSGQCLVKFKVRSRSCEGQYYVKVKDIWMPRSCKDQGHVKVKVMWESRSCKVKVIWRSILCETQSHVTLVMWNVKVIWRSRLCQGHVKVNVLWRLRPCEGQGQDHVTVNVMHSLRSCEGQCYVRLKVVSRLYKDQGCIKVIWCWGHVRFKVIWRSWEV